MTGSNRRQPPCKGGTLPTELTRLKFCTHNLSYYTPCVRESFELDALRTPEVIIPHQALVFTLIPSRTASTLSTTGSVLALPAAFRFKDYHPLISLNFSSCGSQYLLIRQNVLWSEYKDSNLGPPGPKPGALPDCATLRIVSF